MQISVYMYIYIYYTLYSYHHHIMALLSSALRQLSRPSQPARWSPRWWPVGWPIRWACALDALDGHGNSAVLGEDHGEIFPKKTWNRCFGLFWLMFFFSFFGFGRRFLCQGLYDRKVVSSRILTWLNHQTWAWNGRCDQQCQGLQANGSKWDEQKRARIFTNKKVIYARDLEEWRWPHSDITVGIPHERPHFGSFSGQWIGWNRSSRPLKRQ